MSAEPIASLYESADQPLPAFSASPRYTPRLNFEESQIAMVMLMMLGNRAAQLYHIGDGLSVCFQTP